MDEKSWQNVKEIFLDALEKDAGARADFLDAACAENTELRREVESFLATHEEIEDFIEEPAFQVEDVFTNDAGHAEKHFGNYRIIHEIGAGGMGAVFLAERNDGEFEQQVAVKIIRQAIAEREIIDRFKRERQILAKLNHPNIAKLLDGGVSVSGEPFLAMEYVEGQPLLEFAKNLEIEEKLKLFLKICSAVSFAHRNLVVHRDLKPSNILVNPEGEPKLLDFGLAKILDFEADPSQTATAFRALTPAYASPEQLSGKDVTTVSDVYSLGVVLYELLTGSRPFDFKGKSLEEIIKTVSESEPFLPSRIRNPNLNVRNLKGDIDNIISFALRKEPERRYRSIEQFAGDIDRHLRNLPIEARPNTYGYRVGKFVKRNWGISTVAAMLLLSLIVGFAATAWEFRVAAAQRDRAERRFNDVRKLSSSLLFEISPQIERLPSSTQARETIVRRALEYLDSLAAEAADNESLQSELASAYEQVGDVQGKPGKANLGDLKGATESYRKAKQIRLALGEKHPDKLELKKLLAANYYSIGDLLWWSNDVDKALENYRIALGLYENLAALEPESLKANLPVIRTQLGIATALAFNVDRRQSIPIYRQMIIRLEKLEAKNPSDIEVQRLLENAHINLAYDLSWEDQMDESAEEVKISTDMGETLLAANPNDTQIRRALWLTYFLAGGIFEDAAPRRSRQFLEKSIELVKRTVETDMVDSQAKHDLAQSYSKLSVIAVSEKKFDEAVELLKKSQDILNELATAEPRHGGYKLNSANNLMRLGDAQEGKGDLTSALESYAQAFVLHNKLSETDPNDNMPLRNIGISNQKMAEICEKLRQFKKAADYNQKGLEIFGRLKEKNVLDDYDKKNIDSMQKSLVRCQEKLSRKLG